RLSNLVESRFTALSSIARVSCCAGADLDLSAAALLVGWMAAVLVSAARASEAAASREVASRPVRASFTMVFLGDGVESAGNRIARNQRLPRRRLSPSPQRRP